MACFQALEMHNIKSAPYKKQYGNGENDISGHKRNI
jgi:hypothetical protein